MAGEVLTMEQRMALLAAGERPGVRVADLCREMGVSRQTYYVLRRRLAEEGPAGLEPRSRRPHRSPGRTPVEVEELVVRLRKELPVDNGAQTIAYHLQRAGIAAPSVRTIHRILVRRGMVTPQPEKRPRSSYRRFEYSRPNECWQIDATEWPIEGGVRAWIMDLIDDHSRFVPAAVVGEGQTAALAWAAVEAAMGQLGVPAMVLSDNGACFSHRSRSGRAGAFEENLAALGVRTITSRPYHPQTCGKIERFHQTLKGWLLTQPVARHHDDLQAQLDEFLDFYNHHRPHRALDGATPAEAWAATEVAHPGEAFTPAPAIHLGGTKVDRFGTLGVGRAYRAHVGAEHAGKTLTVIRYADTVVILDGHHLVRHFQLDRTRRYQPSGRQRGPRPTKLSAMS